MDCSRALVIYREGSLSCLSFVMTGGAEEWEHAWKNRKSCNDRQIMR